MIRIKLTKTLIHSECSGGVGDIRTVSPKLAKQLKDSGIAVWLGKAGSGPAETAATDGAPERRTRQRPASKAKAKTKTKAKTKAKAKAKSKTVTKAPSGAAAK